MTALAAVVILAQVQVRDAPKDWRLLASDNFNIYYPSDGLLPRARQFAGWFEDARRTLADRTGSAPRRVNVYLYASYHDLLQSSYLSSFRGRPLWGRLRRPALREGGPEPRFCRPNPRSRALALAEPLRDRIFIHCQASDRWNAWFARHELAHHAQFEHLYPWRLPSWVVAAKDPLVSWWWMEGGADFLAGIFETRTDEFMRDLAREGLYDLKELFFPDVLNPYDYKATYTQGSYFWRFVEEKYGRARELFRAGGEGLPIPSQAALEEVVGKDREEIEKEFAEHLKIKWTPVLQGRGVPADRLTDSREYYRRRSWGGRWSPDGKHLAWITDAGVYPELVIDGRGVFRARRGIDIGYVVSPPSWSPDSRRVAVIEWGTNRDNLLLVDAKCRMETIRLPFDEVYDPAWSPDGGRIAFAALKDGTSDLYVLHLADRRVERITEDPEGDFQPAWSPDGRLAFVKEVEGRTVLHVHGRGAVTKSWALLEYPQWSPDGKSIAVAADVGGVTDAFAVDPGTGKAKRLTKFAGGISHPAYHPDGSIVVTYYEGRGQDLYRVRPEPQDEPAFDQEDRRGWYESFRAPAPRGEPSEKSRAWGVNWLMFPVSSQSLVMPGLEFEFGDRDAENTLSIGASALSTNSWSTNLTFANTRYRPEIGASVGYGRTGDLIEGSAQPFVNVPLWPFMEVGAGWIGRYREEREGNDYLGDFFDSGPAAAFRFSNQDGYQYRDPAWGFALGGSAKWFSEHLGGDRERREYYGFLEASRDIVQDLIVWGRLDYEKTVGDEFLDAELLEIGGRVRGAEDLRGVERGGVTVELRFPLWRDLMWKPLEAVGVGEWLILKDLRGFVFGDVGYVGEGIEDAGDPARSAASAGAGLRLDLSFMLWPIVNGRAPVRLEAWWAIVGQDGQGARGAAGWGFVLGF